MKIWIYFFIIFSLCFYLFQCEYIEEIKDYQTKDFYLKTNETKNFTFNATNYFSYYLKVYINIITRKISTKNSTISLYVYIYQRGLYYWANLNRNLDKILQFDFSDKTIFYFVFKPFTPNNKEENNFISFQVFNSNSYANISNYYFKFDTFQINSKKSYTFTFYTKNELDYLDYNIDSNVEYFSIMDKNRKQLASYKNKLESISL